MMQRMRTWTMLMAVVITAVVVGAACAKKQASVVRPAPPPATTADTGMGTTPEPPPPAPPVRDEPIAVAPAAADPAIGSKNLDELNRESPLGPVYFALDSFELSAEARTQLQGAAGVLKQNGTWQVTVEGHCDERGTAEYNLSLGERRALAAKAYLVSLGVAADRLRTVSYGREFPFDPGHDDAAWAKNRRAHFVITAK
jgi:peptidoglycan-associated lipoprotein